MEFYKKLFPIDKNINSNNSYYLYHKMILGGISGNSTMLIVFPLDLIWTWYTTLVEIGKNKLNIK